MTFSNDTLALSAMNIDLASNILTWAWQDTHGDLADQFAEWGRWNQGTWFTAPADGEGMPSLCGSTACIAGQTVAQVGYRMDVRVSNWDNDDKPTEVSASECLPQVFDHIDPKTGHPIYKDVTGAEPESISDVAQRALGLTMREADELFAGSNSIARVAALMISFAAARGQSLKVSDEIVEAGKDYYSYHDLEDEMTETWGRWYDEDARAKVRAVMLNLCPTCGQTQPA